MKKRIILFTIMFYLYACSPSVSAKIENKLIIPDKPNSVAVIYSSKYGSTALIAKWISEGIGKNAVAIEVSKVENLSGYLNIILGTAIYRNRLHPDMYSFIKKNKVVIKEKLVSFFVVCGDASKENDYLTDFTRELDYKPKLTQGFRGRMKKAMLSSEDFQILKRQFAKVGRPFEDYDFTDKDACVEFGKKIATVIYSVK